MGAYKNLMSIVDQTRLQIEIRGTAPDLILAATQDGRELATVPFEPGHEDEAAMDLSRRLTLDGKPPPGLEWGT